jgi:hypothetical protein
VRNEKLPNAGEKRIIKKQKTKGRKKEKKKMKEIKEKGHKDEITSEK